MSKPFDASKKSLIAINAKLGYAAILLTTGLYIWPQKLIDYGWGILGFFLIAAAAGLTIDALKQIFSREDFIRQQREFHAQGNEVKTSRLATAPPIKKGVRVK